MSGDAVKIACKHDQPGDACLAESGERRESFRAQLYRDGNQAHQAPLVRHIHHGFGMPDLGTEQVFILQRNLHIESL